MHQSVLLKKATDGSTQIDIISIDMRQRDALIRRDDVGVVNDCEEEESGGVSWDVVCRCCGRDADDDSCRGMCTSVIL